jgi:hypothetical protein
MNLLRADNSPESETGRQAPPRIRSRAPRRGALALFLFSGLLATGCSQQLGDRCQVDSDCASGLYCNLNGGTPAMGGICQGTGTSLNVDLSIPTADLTAPADQGTDLSSVDGDTDLGKDAK